MKSAVAVSNVDLRGEVDFAKGQKDDVVFPVHLDHRTAQAVKLGTWCWEKNAWPCIVVPLEVRVMLIITELHKMRTVGLFATSAVDKFVRSKGEENSFWVVATLDDWHW